MNKTLARAEFVTKGIIISPDCTFASQNSGSGFYWLNPNVAWLSKEWTLILNDIDNHTLHLFVIPTNSINKNDVICRADRPDNMDIQIVYDDPDFTDIRSGIKFSPWYKTSVEYDAIHAAKVLSNKKKLSAWKGGDPSSVELFNAPYTYEKCLLGVTTDGHAVYDFNLAADYYVKKTAGYNVSDDRDYELRYQWTDMVDHDYRFFETAKSKVPFFLEEGEGDEPIPEEKYDFSKCILGHSFRFGNTIYSLKKMIEVIMKTDGCSKEAAKQICYNYSEAGSAVDGSSDFYNYAILDECLDDIPVTFSK